MAGLTKQHFESIAEIINKETLISVNDGYKFIPLVLLIDSLSDYFKSQNPMFNENQFKKACLK